MSAQIMIVTPSSSFGESLQRYLEEMGFSGLILVRKVEDAMELSYKTQLDLAILDFNMGEYPLRKTAQIMRESLPNIRLLITSSQDDSDPPIMSELNAVGVFSEPFYLVDIKEKIPKISELTDKTDRTEKLLPTDKPLEGFPWLQDINRAAQHLASISLSTAAQAALIVNEDKLWAYAGELSQSAANELTEWVVKNWSQETLSDLVRFIDLEAGGGEYMLYATKLSKSMVLALAFDAKMPFSRIRSQVNYLASALASPPDEDLLKPDDYQTKEHFINALNGSDSVRQSITQPLFSSDEVPPPTPETTIQSFVDELNQGESLANPSVEGDQPVSIEKKLTLGELPLDSSDLSSGVPFDGDNDKNNNSGRPSQLYSLNSNDIFSKRSGNEAVRDNMSVSPSMYSLYYSCVIIPRLPGHKLKGELADRVVGFIEHIFLAFGWRLESLEISPDYVQWIANIPPSVSPGYMLHVMREHLSRFIFAEFPRMGRENPSGDFWAPGFLLVSGIKTLPGQLIDDFIERTRQNQNFQHK